MFSNLIIAGSICSDRKAAKGPKSSCQATTQHSRQRLWIPLIK